MLADLVLYAHFAFVAFVILGAAGIVFGKILHWGWTGNAPFRFAHLAAILFVAIEALLGVACPLTIWENRLRGETGDGIGFLAYWVHEFLYYDFPAWAFTALYLSFALFVALLYWWSPPRLPSRRRAAAPH